MTYITISWGNSGGTPVHFGGKFYLRVEVREGLGGVGKAEQSPHSIFLSLQHCCSNLIRTRVYIINFATTLVGSGVRVDMVDVKHPGDPLRPTVLPFLARGRRNLEPNLTAICYSQYPAIRSTPNSTRVRVRVRGAVHVLY